MAAPHKPVILAEPGLRVEGLILTAIDGVDGELDEPGMRDAVDALIIDEMRRFPPPDYLTASHLPPMPPPSTILTAPTASAAITPPSAYETALAPSASATFDSAAAEVSAWRAAADRAAVALEHQTARSINAELMSRFSVEAWKTHVAGLERLQAAAKARVDRLAAKLEEVQASRRARADAVAHRLRNGVRRWTEAAEANTVAELACVEAEAEVWRLRRAARAAGLLVQNDEEEEDAAGAAAAGAGAAHNAWHAGAADSIEADGMLDAAAAAAATGRHSSAAVYAAAAAAAAGSNGSGGAGTAAGLVTLSGAADAPRG